MVSPCKNKPIHKLQYAPQNVDTSINDLVWSYVFYKNDSIFTVSNCTSFISLNVLDSIYTFNLASKSTKGDVFTDQKSVKILRQLNFTPFSSSSADQSSGKNMRLWYLGCMYFFQSLPPVASTFLVPLSKYLPAAV